jgi:hypothetical protein
MSYRQVKDNRTLKRYAVAREAGMDEDWPAVLDEYGVQFLVLGRHGDSELLELFQAQPGWAVDFEDEEATIFARADGTQFSDPPICRSTS